MKTLEVESSHFYVLLATWLLNNVPVQFNIEPLPQQNVTANFMACVAEALLQPRAT